MQIVNAYKYAVHTHYLTNGERMRATDVQVAERCM